MIDKVQGRLVLERYMLYLSLFIDVEWSILKRSNTPKSFDSRCNLCLEEKMHILHLPEPKKTIK